VTLVVSMLAALVALKPGVIAGHVPVEWLILGFPVASTCLAFLNFKAERAITNLRRFVSSLERLELDSHGLPSYNTDPQLGRRCQQGPALPRFRGRRAGGRRQRHRPGRRPAASIRSASAKSFCCSARPS
jgi:hypothetical protein